LLAGVYLTTRLGVAMQQHTTMGAPPPPTSLPGATACNDPLLTVLCFDSPNIAYAWTHREHCFQQFLCCCVHTCCYRNRAQNA
jgi:hypothetical protein